MFKNMFLFLICNYVPLYLFTKCILLYLLVTLKEKNIITYSSIITYYLHLVESDLIDCT